MKTTCKSPRRLLAALAGALLIALSASAAAPAAAGPFAGRWALTLPNGAAGWIEVAERGGWLDGAILWGGGSVLPAAHVHVHDGVLTLTRVSDVERKDAAGKIVRRQQLTETVTARIEGDLLRGVRVVPRASGEGVDRGEITGRRIPPLPARPDLAKVKFGDPVALFNGRDLAGWQLRDAGHWSVRDGAILAANGHGIHYAPGEYADFELLAVVKSNNHVNAGLFLRGQPAKPAHRGFEVQIYSPPDAVYPTGSIYGQTRADIPEDHDGRWALLRVKVRDGRVTTWLDGRLAAEGPVPPGVPARGRIGLQIHLDTASIECKELRVRALQGSE